jgi:hypothetical protein
LVELRSCNRKVCAFAIQNAPRCILVSPIKPTIGPIKIESCLGPALWTEVAGPTLLTYTGCVSGRAKAVLFKVGVSQLCAPVYLEYYTSYTLKLEHKICKTATHASSFAIPYSSVSVEDGGRGCGPLLPVSVRLSRVHPIPSPASAAEVYAIRLLSRSVPTDVNILRPRIRKNRGKAIFF